jgi:integrase
MVKIAIVHKRLSASDIKPRFNGRRWRYDYYFSYADETGKKSYSSRYGDTIDACIQDTLQFQLRIDKGEIVKKIATVVPEADVVMTVEEVCIEWMQKEVVGKGIIRQGTAERYMQDIKNYIALPREGEEPHNRRKVDRKDLPLIGNIPYNELTYEDVNSLLQAMFEGGLCQRSIIKGPLTRLRHALEFKRKQDFLAKRDTASLDFLIEGLVYLADEYRDKFKAKKVSQVNVIARDKYGKKVSDKVRKSLSKDELERFISALFGRGYRLALAFLLSATLGLRKGEVLAIKREQVHLDTKLINIEIDLARLGTGFCWKTLKPINVEIREDAVKTDDSNRSTYLSDTLVALLSYHMKKLDDEKRAFKPHMITKVKKGVKIKEWIGGYGVKTGKKLEDGTDVYEDKGYLFATKNGTPTEPRNYGRTFEKVMTKDYSLRSKMQSLGITGKTVHGLRTTFATFLKNVAKAEVSEVGQLLGHAPNNGNGATSFYLENPDEDDVRILFDNNFNHHLEFFHTVAQCEIWKRDPGGTKKYI